MIPPHQKIADELIRLDLGQIPEINIKDYRLAVSGDILNPVVLTYGDIADMGKDKVIGDFHCVTGWTKESAEWEGILTKKIAAMVNPGQDAKYVLIGSYDGYTTNVDIDFFLRDNSLLAIKYGGKTLTPEHGFPVRLVIPDKYAYKSAKWVNAIKFLKKEDLGYWEKRGYSNSADPFKEERYA
jgi:DMSO/TMAO reductase YedYZ molybdopterin-dependent catalytic subunit